MSFARLPRVVFSVGIAALLGSLAVPARAATTTYTSVYTGGTIAPDDTVLLNNGATVTGNVTANGCAAEPCLLERCNGRKIPSAHHSRRQGCPWCLFAACPAVARR